MIELPRVLWQKEFVTGGRANEWRVVHVLVGDEHRLAVEVNRGPDSLGNASWVREWNTFVLEAAFLDLMKERHV